MSGEIYVCGDICLGRHMSGETYVWDDICLRKHTSGLSSVREGETIAYAANCCSTYENVALAKFSVTFFYEGSNVQ